MAFKKLISKNSEQIKICMPRLIPTLSSDVNDITANVKKYCSEVLEMLMYCSGNNDLNSFIPDVLKGLKNSNNIYDSVESLASCVFVQNVESPALAVTVPILLKGLKDSKTVTKRLACVIIDNMCKLIEHPKEILPFYTKLKTSLEFAVEVISDPEARNVCNRALNTLKSSCSVDENTNYNKSSTQISEMIKEQADNNKVQINNLNYLSVLVSNICNSHNFEKDEWVRVFSKCTEVNDSVNNIIDTIYDEIKKSFEVKEDVFEDTEEVKNLYQG